MSGSPPAAAAVVAEVPAHPQEDPLAAPAAAAAAAADAAAPLQSTAAAPAAASAPVKVVIVFSAAGGAPLLKADRVRISADSSFSKVVAHLQRALGVPALFVYLRTAFCPGLDERVGVLADAYGSEGRLHVSYALTPAWG